MRRSNYHSKRVGNRTRKHRRIDLLGSWFKKRLKLLGISLVLVTATTIVFLSVYFYQFLNQNLVRAGDSGSLTTRDLETGHDFNLVFFKVRDLNDPTSLIESLFLANFQVSQKRVNFLNISPDESLSSLKNPGRVKLASLYGRSKLSGSENLWDLAQKLTYGLGWPVDGLFYTDEAGFDRISKELGNSWADWQNSLTAFSRPLKVARSLFLLGSAYQTNLSPNSFLNFSRWLVFNPPQSFKIYEAGNLSLSPERLDLLLRQNFVDQEMEQERLKIIVLNSTGRSGLASAAGRLASNLGLTLLSVGNTEDNRDFPDSMLVTKSKNYYSVSRLLGIFAVKDLRLANESRVADDPRFVRLLRADLVLILGKDQTGSEVVDKD